VLEVVGSEVVGSEVVGSEVGGSEVGGSEVGGSEVGGSEVVGPEGVGGAGSGPQPARTMTEAVKNVTRTLNVLVRNIAGTAATPFPHAPMSFSSWTTPVTAVGSRTVRPLSSSRAHEVLSMSRCARSVSTTAQRIVWTANDLLRAKTLPPEERHSTSMSW
jgi:hypothetical protein